MVIDSGLRERLEALLEYEGEMPHKAAVALAAQVLAIPEIKEALELRSALNTPGAIQILSGPPILNGQR